MLPLTVVQPGMTSAEVCNTVAPTVITCEIISYGQLQNGAWVNTINTVPVFPGQCGYAYNYANPPFFFINGYGQANCY
jgi:hypothetical protein